MRSLLPSHVARELVSRRGGVGGNRRSSGIGIYGGRYKSTSSSGSSRVGESAGSMLGGSSLRSLSEVEGDKCDEGGVD